MSLFKDGLAHLVYLELQSIACKNQYYFYIIDAWITNAFNLNLYHQKCHKGNTWNFQLAPSSLLKRSILTQSVRYNFGNYALENSDETVLVKEANHGSHHFISAPCHEAHIINRTQMHLYNKHFFEFHKVLTKKDRKELNIFVLRNLESNKLQFLSYYVKSAGKNINRKFDEYIDIQEVDCQKELGDLYHSFICYINSIFLDYGRVELINDKDIGWCIIDVNNSPGKGPLTNRAVKPFTRLMRKQIEI